MQPENPIKFMLITVWTAFSKKIGWTQNRKFTKSLFFKKLNLLQYSTYGMYYCIRIAIVLKGTMAGNYNVSILYTVPVHNTESLKLHFTKK